MTAVVDAVAAGAIGDRVWLYSNYHCNLACTYCLTESAPGVARRELGAERLLRAAEQAAGLGFGALGVTGGEPFLLAYLPETLARMADVLPVVALTNATYFSDERLERLSAFAGRPVSLQISLDAAEPDRNDLFRGPESFRRVVEAVPRIVARGIRVRIATTEPAALEPGAMERLCALHRELGVPDEDHVVRPVVRRGRASTNHLGVPVGMAELPPELTITAEGAFWSPFAATVHGRRLDTDLLVTRTTDPLRIPAEAMIRLSEGRPAGDDATLNIR
ncbi:MAG: radical SAM protein [Acidimicrobiales bacterium]|nr:radical SAM protein [Acidimicrobiales bacterium]